MSENCLEKAGRTFRTLCQKIVRTAGARIFILNVIFKFLNDGEHVCQFLFHLKAYLIEIHAGTKNVFFFFVYSDINLTLLVAHFTTC